MFDLLSSYNIRLVFIGVSLLGASAGVIGTFAVLRRRALTGDALAHASLPGLCAALLLLQQHSMPVLLFGALVAGVLGVIVISLLRRYTRIKEDAAIGIVLSVFFGAGIVLDRFVQDLAQGSKAGVRRYIFGSTASMSGEDLWWLIGLAALTLAAVLFLYKEFKLLAFDPDFARVQGWPVVALDLALMGLIAVAVVIGLPTVGVLMIAALLIIPAATARFWTERLGWMLVFSAFFGVISGLIGTYLSATYEDMPTGATIILVAVTLFVVSAVVAPRRGILGRILGQRISAGQSTPAAWLR